MRAESGVPIFVYEIGLVGYGGCNDVATHTIASTTVNGCPAPTDTVSVCVTFSNPTACPTTAALTVAGPPSVAARVWSVRSSRTAGPPSSATALLTLYGQRAE